MNKKFLTMAGVVAVLSIGTFWGLEIFRPHKVDEAKFPASVSTDQVFAGKLDPNGPSEAPATANNAASTTAAAAPAAGGEPAAAAPAASTSTVATAQGGAMMTPAGTDVTPSAPAASAAAAPASEAPAATTDNTSSAAATSAAPAADTSTAATPEAAAPAASSEPASEPAPAAAPAETAPPAAAEAPAPEPAPAPKHKHKAKIAHHTSGGNGHALTVNTHWWPAENPAQLSVVNAGPASFKKAIVVLFNGAFFKTDGLDANLKVSDKNGKPVSGNWEIGENNRRMLVFPVPANGLYKVSVGTGLTDSQGRKIAHHLDGPVIVR